MGWGERLRLTDGGEEEWGRRWGRRAPVMGCVRGLRGQWGCWTINQKLGQSKVLLFPLARLRSYAGSITCACACPFSTLASSPPTRPHAPLAPSPARQMIMPLMECPPCIPFLACHPVLSVAFVACVSSLRGRRRGRHPRSRLGRTIAQAAPGIPPGVVLDTTRPGRREGGGPATAGGAAACHGAEMSRCSPSLLKGPSRYPSTPRCLRHALPPFWRHASE